MMSPRSLGRPARAALSAALLAAAVLLPSVEEGRAQAPPPGAIAGTIGFEGSASPPAGASVAVYRGLGEEISRVRVSAESAWQFLAGNLPPGTYKILVTPDPALLPSECYAPL